VQGGAFADQGREASAEPGPDDRDVRVQLRDDNGSQEQFMRGGTVCERLIAANRCPRAGPHARQV